MSINFHGYVFMYFIIKQYLLSNVFLTIMKSTDQKQVTTQFFQFFWVNKINIQIRIPIQIFTINV